MDWKPFLDFLFGLLDVTVSTVITVAVPFGVAWALGKMKVDKATVDKINRDIVYVALEKGIAYGRDKALKALGTLDTTIEVENEIVKFALEYAATNVPETLAKLGITKDKLATLITARLAEAGITADPLVVTKASKLK